MQHQLIVTFLGTDRSGIFSEIASLVAEVQCNILDSRQAVYGTEFSLTMIIEGSHSAITKAECMLPAFCQRHHLLSMMKRTKHHVKQNLEHLFDVEFSGPDHAGLIRSVTRFFADRGASISAFRQRTYLDQDKHLHMRCKFVVTIEDSVDFEELEHALLSLFSTLNVSGKVTDKFRKEQHEDSPSW